MWELNITSTCWSMCNISFSRLKSCTMLIVYSGDFVMEQVRWWRPLTPPLAARKPERAWVKPTRATGNVQRQVPDLRPVCLCVSAWTLGSLCYIYSSFMLLMWKQITVTLFKFFPLSVSAAHVLTWEWIRKPDGRVSCQDEGWVTFFTHMTSYLFHSVFVQFSFFSSTLGFSGLAGFARLCAGDQYEVRNTNTST